MSRAGATDLSAEMDGFETWVIDEMAAWRVPGLALAGIKDGEVAHIAGMACGASPTPCP